MNATDENETFAGLGLINSYTKEQATTVANQIRGNGGDAYVYLNPAGTWSVLNLKTNTTLREKILTLRAFSDSQLKDTLVQYPWNSVQLYAAARRRMPWDAAEDLKGQGFIVHEDGIYNLQTLPDDVKKNPQLWNLALPSELPSTDQNYNPAPASSVESDKSNNSTVIFIGVAVLIVTAIAIYHFFVK